MHTYYAYVTKFRLLAPGAEVLLRPGPLAHGWDVALFPLPSPGREGIMVFCPPKFSSEKE